VKIFRSISCRDFFFRFDLKCGPGLRRRLRRFPAVLLLLADRLHVRRRVRRQAYCSRFLVCDVRCGRAVGCGGLQQQLEHGRDLLVDAVDPLVESLQFSRHLRLHLAHRALYACPRRLLLLLMMLRLRFRCRRRDRPPRSSPCYIYITHRCEFWHVHVVVVSWPGVRRCSGLLFFGSRPYMYILSCRKSFFFSTKNFRRKMHNMGLKTSFVENVLSRIDILCTIGLISSVRQNSVGYFWSVCRKIATPCFAYFC